MTSIDICSTSHVITFDRNWNLLYSSSAGGKDLSNDTQIRVIGLVEPEISTKRLRNLSEKLQAKLLATMPRYTIKYALLNDTLSELFDLEASPIEGQSLQQKDKGRIKQKGAKNFF